MITESWGKKVRHSRELERYTVNHSLFTVCQVEDCSQWKKMIRIIMIKGHQTKMKCHRFTNAVLFKPSSSCAQGFITWLCMCHWFSVYFCIPNVREWSVSQINSLNSIVIYHWFEESLPALFFTDEQKAFCSLITDGRQWQFIHPW